MLEDRGAQPPTSKKHVYMMLKMENDVMLTEIPCVFKHLQKAVYLPISKT